MRKLLFGFLILTVSVVAGTTTAKAQTELEIVSGTSTYTATGSSPQSYTNFNFNGWSIIITTGQSNSPNSLPYGILLSTVDLSCALASCESDPLSITFSGTGFTETSLGFDSSYTVTLLTGTASTTQTAWYDTSNMLGAETNEVGSPLTFSGPIAVGSKTTTGGSAGPGDYSLTIEDTFNANPNGGTFFAANGDIAASPEPATMLLFGSGLVLFGGILRRRRLHAS